MLSTITASHAVAHVVIFFGYIAAMVLVPGTFMRIMRLSTITKIGAAGFFLCCGITHIGLAFEKPYSLTVSVNDHMQAVFILLFVFGLVQDLNRTQRRLDAAYVAIGVKYDAETARIVRGTMQHALKD